MEAEIKSHDGENPVADEGDSVTGHGWVSPQVAAAMRGEKVEMGKHVSTQE